MKLKPAYLDLAGASAYTGGGLSVRTLRRLIAEGRLPAFRPGGPGGKILIRRIDLEALVESCPITSDLDGLVDEVIASLEVRRV